jgi:hypothetical protein
VVKKIVGAGVGVAVFALAGTIAYRHFMLRAPSQADAAPPPPKTTSRVITLGAEAPPTTEPGKVLISPVTPKQPMPKAIEPAPKPTAATRPAPPPAVAPAAQPRSVVPALPAKPTTQPVQKSTPKKKVISLTGDAQAAAKGSGAAGAGVTPQEKAALSLVHQLHALRAGIDMWRTRHGGQAPDFVAGAMWEQFTQRDEAGQVILSGTPVNPLNGQSRVAAVAKEPQPGEAVKGAFGYVYAVNTGKLMAVDAMGRVFDDAAVDTVALESRAVGEWSAKEKERYVLAALDALREQTARYAMEHNGRPPDFAKYPAFEQLLKPTLANGQFAEGPDVSVQRFGPYILSAPVNALNGRHKVAAVAGEVRPGQRIDRADAGFVFSLSTNRLFATDASGLVYDDTKARAGYVPADAGGTGGAAARANVSAIEMLRAAVAQYRAHHNGLLPDFKRYPKWEQLTGKTRPDGKPDPAGTFGPYLYAVPVNSKNNSSDVDVVAKLAANYRSRKTAGYVFESSTGRIWLTDELGNVAAE